jgi:hypothetical protein
MTTPTQLIDRIRKVNNIVGDNFYSDTEILDHIFDAHTELATKCYLIERTQVTTTVDGTQEYALPSRYYSVKRVEFAGKKLVRIDFDGDDQVTCFDSDTTAKGEPQFYYQWQDSIFLRPIPDTASTLTVFCFMKPQDLVITSTFEICSEFDKAVVDFVSGQLAQKENNFDRAMYYDARWQKYIVEALAKKRMRKRGDTFAQVKDESTMIRASTEWV